MTALCSNKGERFYRGEYKRLIREGLLIARNKIIIAILFAGGKGCFPLIHRQAISLKPCSRKETRRPFIRRYSNAI